MLCVFIFLFSLNNIILASNSGTINLIKFYTGFRKLCLCRCGITQNQVTGMENVLGGDVVTPYEMPWTAIINTENATFRGTLISDKHVITAASLLYELSASQVTVTLGVHEKCKQSNALNVSVDVVIIHPGYSDLVRNNDLALLRLRHAVQFSQFIAPICMPLYDFSEMEQIACTTSWLTHSPQCLARITTIQILTSRSCLSFISNSSHFTSDKGCFGPIGTKNVICKDDIGGPVMTRWTTASPFRLAGVISSASCDENIAPIFSKTVENFIWIQENIRDDCQCF